MAAPLIMIVRHAEKPEGKIQGVEINGTTDPNSLIIQGWQRAGGLATLFAPSRGSLQSPALAVPKYLFASKFDPTKHSKRPYETIEPLAAKLQLKINDSFKKEDYVSMVSAAVACSGPTL